MREASSGAFPDSTPLIGGRECLMPASVNNETFSSVSTLPIDGRLSLPSLTGVVAPEDSGVIATGAIVVDVVEDKFGRGISILLSGSKIFC